MAKAGNSRNSVRSKRKRSILRRIRYGRVAATLGIITMLGLGTKAIISLQSEASTNLRTISIGDRPKISHIDNYSCNTLDVINTINKNSDTPNIIENGTVRCMVYTGSGVTCTGIKPYVGCVAGSKDLLGKSCYLYESKSDGTKGRFIGRFSFNDTGYGVDGNIENGKAICVYRRDMESCNQWIQDYGDNVYIEVINN